MVEFEVFIITRGHSLDYYIMGVFKTKDAAITYVESKDYFGNFSIEHFKGTTNIKILDINAAGHVTNRENEAITNLEKKFKEAVLELTNEIKTNTQAAEALQVQRDKLYKDHRASIAEIKKEILQTLNQNEPET